MHDPKPRMKINQFFTTTLGAQLKNARWSWGAYDSENHRIFLRVWQDGVKTVNGKERVLIARDVPRRKSNGFAERNNHISLVVGGADGYGVACIAVDPKTTETRTIKSFDDQILLRLGEIFNEDGNTYANVIDRVQVKELARPKTGKSTLAADLHAITRQKIEVTTKEALINARVGQGLFRKQVLENWGSACAVTGSGVLDAIRASHIKPWRDSTNKERLDSSNGIPLVANLDALFDAGLITFDETGSLLVSTRLSSTEQGLFNVRGKHLRNMPSHKTNEFLAYHRKMIFRK